MKPKEPLQTWGTTDQSEIAGYVVRSITTHRILYAPTPMPDGPYRPLIFDQLEDAQYFQGRPGINKDGEPNSVEFYEIIGIDADNRARLIELGSLPEFGPPSERKLKP